MEYFQKRKNVGINSKKIYLLYKDHQGLKILPWHTCNTKSDIIQLTRVIVYVKRVKISEQVTDFIKRTMENWRGDITTGEKPGISYVNT